MASRARERRWPRRSPIHLLNGLYDAKLDHVPVVAIVGQTARTAMGGSEQQEVDLHSLYKDVAADYVQTVMAPEQLPNVLDRAMRIAMSRRTVTALIIPSDLQELACGCPVVISTAGALPEVVGDAGLQVHPDDATQRVYEVVGGRARMAPGRPRCLDAL